LNDLSLYFNPGLFGLGVRVCVCVCGGMFMWFMSSQICRMTWV